MFTDIRCFECNYAPSGLSDNPKGWSSVNHVEDAKKVSTADKIGISQCALQHEKDGDYLGKSTCPSGRCFIRRDLNGSRVTLFLRCHKNRFVHIVDFDILCH